MSENNADHFQRLCLANQYEILSRLDPDHGTWANARERVIRGLPIDNVPFMDEILQWSRDPISAEDQKLVKDVLDLYSIIQSAHNSSDSADDYGFPGFDGNDEPKFYSYFDILLSEGRWTYIRLTGNSQNSHHPTLVKYRNMTAMWSKFGSPHKLTTEQITEILAVPGY